MNIFEQYPNSRFLHDLPNDSEFFPLRKRITDLFSFFDDLADPNFQQELDGNHPHAPLWAMMLAKILKSEGYQPIRANSGPDFVVEQDGKKIFIEATCPMTGEEGKPDSVPPILCGAPIAQDVPEESIVLRICNALKKKTEQYAQFLDKGIVSADDIYVIAICSSRIDSAGGLWPPVILRATHGLGNPYVIVDRDQGVVGEGIESRDTIPKASGAKVDTTFFLSEDNSSISAVLYSDCSFFSFPFDLYENSMCVHNPKARVPLHPGFIKRIEHIWTIYCHGTSQWRAYRINSA